MKLHEAMDYVLQKANRPMKTKEIADTINQLALYVRGDGRPLPASQVGARAKNYPKLFFKNDGFIHRTAWENRRSATLRTAAASSLGNVAADTHSTTNKAATNSNARGASEKTFPKTQAFHALGTIEYLLQNGLPFHPWISEPGVYILSSMQAEPVFMNPDGVNNVIRPWSLERLEAKWVTGADVVYIGLAGSRTPRSLRQRLGDLLRHANGQISNNGPHKGGEILWQLNDWDKLVVWAKPTGPPPKPREEELRLLDAFLSRHGRLPFANRRR